MSELIRSHAVPSHLLLAWQSNPSDWRPIHNATYGPPIEITEQEEERETSPLPKKKRLSKYERHQMYLAKLKANSIESAKLWDKVDPKTGLPPHEISERNMQECKQRLIDQKKRGEVHDDYCSSVSSGRYEKEDDWEGYRSPYNTDGFSHHH